MTPVSTRRENLEVNIGKKMLVGSPLASPTMGKKFLATSMLSNTVKKTNPSDLKRVNKMREAKNTLLQIALGPTKQEDENEFSEDDEERKSPCFNSATRRDESPSAGLISTKQHHDDRKKRMEEFRKGIKDQLDGKFDHKAVRVMQNPQ